MIRALSSTALTHKGDCRTIKDVTKALQAQFSAARTPLSLPPDSRRLLQHFVDEHDGRVSDEDAAKANLELNNFWERFVGESPQKLGAFVGVLRELRTAITGESDLWEWWQTVVKPVISTIGYKQAALDDAKEFVLAILINADDEQSPGSRKLSKRICKELLDIYIAKTRAIDDDDGFVAPENAQVATQVEAILVAYGKRRPLDFFTSVDDLVQPSATRLQALTLLSSYLRHQAPHTYTAADTPLIESLLKCLMNDTSTTVLTLALTTLVMLLPHIPGSLAPHLPRLFLVYSRLLCWEKFSPLSSDAQRSLVTDDRVSVGSEPAPDHGDVGIDPTWEKIRSNPDAVEAATPEIMTYFTYLYGLYPLNFMSYIRKPRKYLKNVDFPGADDFDLNQTVIRSRSDQFREVHLLHPNFYNLTVEEELEDPKWAKLETADVVADCHALFVSRPTNLVSPGPPPTGKLPDLPPVPTLPPLNVHSSQTNSRQISPVASHASFRSGMSWKESQALQNTSHPAEGDSPLLGPSASVSDGTSISDQRRPTSKASGLNEKTVPSLDDFPRPGNAGSPRERSSTPSNNLAYLQREITILRNDLNFERWHKAQYSQHIGQLARQNVKDVTAEAETLNLINANRALKQQLEHVRQARESTMKDSALTRKQSNNLETHLQERHRAMKKDKEAWMADTAELRRLRVEMKQCRDLLVESEARELSKSHELELIQRDVAELKSVQQQLREATRRLREYEYQEFEHQRGKREIEILQNEKDTLEMQLTRRVTEFDRMKRAYTDRIAELDARADQAEPSQRANLRGSPDTQYLMQQAITDSQAKLAQLKKAHSRLLEKHTDLELEYQSVRSQLDALKGNGKARTFLRDSDSPANPYDYAFTSHDGRPSSGSMSGSGGLPAVDSAYDNYSEYQGHQSTSDPTSKRYQAPFRAGVIPSPSEATLSSAAGLTWRPVVSRAESMASRASSNRPPVTFNQTAPLSDVDEKGKPSAFSDGSSTMSGDKKGKITPSSEVRVYGRGGAQNIKLKSKEKKEDKPEEKKGKGGFRGLRGIM
nr:hypothetical protein B0A51_07292 [Rachicladosporium sp. CCFEE 5018]